MDPAPVIMTLYSIMMMMIFMVIPLIVIIKIATTFLFLTKRNINRLRK
jgi:maltodextrin utilization protein YvdJ